MSQNFGENCTCPWCKKTPIDVLFFLLKSICSCIDSSSGTPCQQTSKYKFKSYPAIVLLPHKQVPVLPKAKLTQELW
jgi:hypothetical protein